MSKTIELQIDKCSTLIDGLRKNVSVLADKGINNDLLDHLGERLKSLSAANSECDALRQTLSEKVKAMNSILTEVKEAYAENKRKIKGSYPQEQWARYGVMDKR